MKFPTYLQILLISGPLLVTAALQQQRLLAGGVDHGNAFSDYSALHANEPKAILATVSIRSGNRLDGVATTYAQDGIAPQHHGSTTGGTLNTLTLNRTEEVVTVTACSGLYRSSAFKHFHTRIFSLYLQTTEGRTLFGGKPESNAADCVTWTAPTGMGLVGWDGRDGDEIDAIAPIWGTLQ